MKGEDPIHGFRKREISIANIRFQLVFYRRRISIFKGVLKVKSGLIWSFKKIFKQVHEHIGPKIDIHVDMAVYVAQETRHVLDDLGVFFLFSSEVHAAFPIDCGLIGNGLGEPILTPAVSITAGARSGQMVSGVHIGDESTIGALALSRACVSVALRNSRQNVPES